jgi:uncharacterized damage-inducible protein DinB
MIWTYEQIQDLFDYLRWADLQMLHAVSTIPDDEYYKDRQISAGSIHKLLVHAMAAQGLWLQRWRGQTPKRIEDHTDYPTRKSVEDRWPVVHLALTEFLEDQTYDSINASFSYHTMRGEEVSGTLAEFMFHLVDHGSYHRGQLNTMIKQAGGTPITVGFRNYITTRVKAER